MGDFQPSDSQTTCGSAKDHKADPRENARGQRRGRLDMPNIVIAFFTAVLGLVAISQMSSLEEANKIAAEAANAANESAKLASQSVKLAGDTAEKQLRAYVFAIRGQVLGIDGDGPMKIRVTIKNSGQTPASEVAVEMDTGWERFPPPLPPPPPKPGAMEATAMPTPIEEGVQTALASGEQLSIEHTFDTHLRQRLKDKTITLHAAGTIYYKDVYGRKQKSSFHFIQGGRYDPAASTMGIGPDVD